jgi:hypothetical protein
MRPIPHTNETGREETDERVRLTTRCERKEQDADDDETWLAVPEV